MAEDLSLVNSFRCYIEIGESNFRIVVKDVPKTSMVTLYTILEQLKEVNRGPDMSYETHQFWIFSEKKKRLNKIEFKDYLIPNASKIKVSKMKSPALPVANDSKVKKKSTKLRTKTSNLVQNWNRFESKCWELVLIETIDYLSSKVPAMHFEWSEVSKLMSLCGYPELRTFQCRTQFYSLLGQFFCYANHRRLDSTIDSKTIEVFRRIESMNLKPFVTKLGLKWIKHRKTWIVVKDTMNWLLVQTSKASLDCDYRNGQIMPLVNKERTGIESKTESEIKHKTRKPMFKIDSIDSKLVSVIYKLEVNGLQYFDWPTIKYAMCAGADFYDTHPLKERFKRLLANYVSVLERLVRKVDAINEWPLFEKISNIDLRPFCDQITYEKIQRLRARMDSELDTISESNRKTRNSSHYYNKYSKSTQKSGLNSR